MPPASRTPDDLPAFPVPWPHRVTRAEMTVPCGCCRTVRVGEVYVTIGKYGRVNCWDCLVSYGWATLDDVPEPIRAEVTATQHRKKP